MHEDEEVLGLELRERLLLDPGLGLETPELGALAPEHHLSAREEGAPVRVVGSPGPDANRRDEHHEVHGEAERDHAEVAHTSERHRPGSYQARRPTGTGGVGVPPALAKAGGTPAPPS